MEKWKNEQQQNITGNNNEKHYGIRIDNVASESIPDTTMKFKNKNSVIVNPDRNESATVVINNDGPELEVQCE